MPCLLFLFSQYELLTRTAQYLSTLDLFHTALTSHELHSYILKSPRVFAKLKRLAICDGHGLARRQRGQWDAVRRRVNVNPIDRRTGGPTYDEEIEVRLYRLQCDAANALPCIKCGVNVCEECRYYPRVNHGNRTRYPPFDDTSARQNDNMVCFCRDCDARVEARLPLSLDPVCVCDGFTRWICYRCREREASEIWRYYNTRTELFMGGDLEFDPDGIYLEDHQFERTFWCPCGVRAPRDGNVRCAWCLRKHDERNARRATWIYDD